ncbi:DUF1404 domain-containing protein [Sulfurisphaera ohwakuensis]|uniref:DUF1404 domain-containing protein n=1 Tax=Sulfurisphaera ohwakuensis TaxID=69656 RepID=UPI0036F2291D
MELTPEEKRYLIFGLVLIIASINPLSLMIASQLEIARFSFDMLLVWGAGLIGVYLAKLMYIKGDEISKSILSLNYKTKGVLYSWGIGGALLTLWYLPNFFDLSVISTEYRALQILSFIIAGIIGGIGWEALGKAMRSFTLFSMFSMMAAVAEIFLEMAGYYSVNYYPVYPTYQLVQTSYMLFVMAAVPSTYYMVKVLKDLGLF